MLSSTSRSGRRIQPLLGLLALIAVLLQLVPASPAAAADENTVGVATRPAGADGLPDGRTRFSYSADPGQAVTDQVLVGNTGSARQDFTVYVTDAFNAPNGEFSLLATAESPTSIGAWARFDNGENRIQFSLEPDEVRLVTFTIQFPADATPGDHVGGLVASVVEEGQQVSLDRRVATAIFARVSGELQPRLTIGSFDAAYQGDWWNPFGGTVKILYTVDNSGNVALAGNVNAGVNTWFGIPATAGRGGSIPVLLPGNSATYEFELTGVGQWGYLNPAVKLSPFVESSDTSLQLPVTAVSRDTVVVAMPWLLLLVIAIGVGIYFLLRWRRHRDEVRTQEWIDYTELKAAEAAEQAASLAGAGAGRSTGE